MARRIFSGLRRISGENGGLEAGIAHHWQQRSPRDGRCFVRPGIHFHHGRELEMAEVIASLARARRLPLDSHISRIHSPTAWTLDIELSQPDKWLPWLLGYVPSMILPAEWGPLNNFASQPIGTGPYAVSSNNNSQLKIRACDDQFV